MNKALEQAAAAIRKTENAIAVTGAGASVESGIPHFRSAGGLWTKYPPEIYATFEAFIDDPDKVWEMFYELGDTLRGAEPNPGHLALARLEELGHLKAVVTQNIDALHQAAGNTTVIEYHGNAATLICPACHRRRATDDGHRPLAPRCECGGYMKPDVVLFGEMIPPNALYQAESLARSCEVMIVVGTSAQVYPAAALPLAAKEQGAVVIECNTEPTDFTSEGVTDIFLEGPAGEILPALVARITAQDTSNDATDRL